MTRSPLLATLRLPGFISFLTVAFINAMVDLGHKILIQNTIFKIYDDATQVALTAVVNGLILLPFILFFSPAGYLSDRFNKPTIMRCSAFFAVLITLLLTLSYYQGWFLFAFAMTFILATQSALYSPAKYGYIRELAGEENLAAGNSYLQATTIVAILSGMIVFTVLFELILAGKNYHNEAELIQHIAPVGWALVTLSCIEFLLTWRLSSPRSETNRSPFNWQAYRQGRMLRQNLSTLHKSKIIWYAVLALSLFWGVSQTFLATFPAFAKIVLAEDNTMVIQGLLACSGIGIIIGSLLAGSNHAPSRQRCIFIGAIGMCLSLFVMPHLTVVWGFALAILFFGFFGGLFIVPLNALIQETAALAQLGTIIAGNNWVQNVVMVSLLIMTFSAAKVSVSSLTLIHAIPLITTGLALLLAWKTASLRR